MKLRLLYFCLGIAVSVVACGFLLLWDSHQEYKVKKRALESFGNLVNPAIYKDEADLVGRWHGRNDSNDPFVITRRSNGTYTRITQSRHTTGVKFTENGYWTYSPPTYVEVDAASPLPRPFATKIIPCSATEFQYKVSEGAYMSETKE